MAQVATSHLRYDQWRDGTLVRSETEVFAMRWWGVEEFRLALRQTGFTTVRIYGDYDLTVLPRSGHQTLTFKASR